MDDLFMTGASQDEVWPLVRDFHYSKRMPSAIQHCFAWRGSGGLFGDFGEPQAAVIYGNPVNRNWPSDALELQRLVRRDDFTMPLSQLVGWSLRWLRQHTNVPFVLSYAGTEQEHHGGIYQATNFIFVDTRTEACPAFLLPNGIRKHSRQVNRELGSRSIAYVAKMRPDWIPISGQPKYLYIKPLRQRLTPLLRRFGWEQLPYPKNNAACLSDAPSPDGVSREHTPEAAP